MRPPEVRASALRSPRCAGGYRRGVAAAASACVAPGWAAAASCRQPLAPALPQAPPTAQRAPGQLALASQRIQIRPLGLYQLKGLETPKLLYQVSGGVCGACAAWWALWPTAACQQGAPIPAAAGLGSPACHPAQRTAPLGRQPAGSAAAQPAHNLSPSPPPTCPGTPSAGHAGVPGGPQLPAARRGAGGGVAVGRPAAQQAQLHQPRQVGECGLTLLTPCHAMPCHAMHASTALPCPPARLPSRAAGTPQARPGPANLPAPPQLQAQLDVLDGEVAQRMGQRQQRQGQPRPQPDGQAAAAAPGLGPAHGRRRLWRRAGCARAAGAAAAEPGRQEVRRGHTSRAGAGPGVCLLPGRQKGERPAGGRGGGGGATRAATGRTSRCRVSPSWGLWAQQLHPADPPTHPPTHPTDTPHPTPPNCQVLSSQRLARARRPQRHRPAAAPRAPRRPAGL
jgi:hypothetical protein